MDFLFLFEQERSVEQPYLVKPLDEKQFALELAYHEASHLVIEQLIHKLTLGFKPSEKIEIFSNKRHGQVQGFGAIYTHNNFWTQQTYDNFKSFYEEDQRRIWADCLILIAGYASYLVFMGDSEYFISEYDENTSKEVKLYKISTVPHKTIFIPPNKWREGISDFAKIKERLTFIYEYDKEKFDSLYSRLLGEMLTILKIKSVNMAVRYVKNHLIRSNNNHPISGKHFDRIKLFLAELLKNISIENSVSSLDFT